MALPLANSLEGGSAGVTVSSANSGGASGDAFDTVTIGAGETLTYDATNPAHGTGLGFKVVTAASVLAAYVEWNTALGTLGTGQTLFVRLYVHLPAVPPSSSNRLIQVLNASTVLCGLNCASGTGKLSLRATGDVLAGTESGTAMSATTLQRVEAQFVGIGSGAGAGSATGRFFAGDSTTPIGVDATASAVNLGAAAPDTIRYGLATANGNGSSNFYFDGLGVGQVDWLGPEGAGPPAVMPQTFNAIPFMR